MNHSNGWNVFDEHNKIVYLISYYIELLYVFFIATMNISTSGDRWHDE